MVTHGLRARGCHEACGDIILAEEASAKALGLTGSLCICSTPHGAFMQHHL